MNYRATNKNDLPNSLKTHQNLSTVGAGNPRKTGEDAKFSPAKCIMCCDKMHIVISQTEAVWSAKNTRQKIDGNAIL
jgi:hypothetical protein